VGACTIKHRRGVKWKKLMSLLLTDILLYSCEIIFKDKTTLHDKSVPLPNGPMTTLLAFFFWKGKGGLHLFYAKCNAYTFRDDVTFHFTSHFFLSKKKKKNSGAAVRMREFGQAFLI
jgi:hypothetical protein